MIASATQVGPGRWAARLNVNGIVVYNCPSHPTESEALEDAQAEIGRRAAAVREAEALARIEHARARALPILLRIVNAQADQLDALLADARRITDGVYLPIAAE